ncbi:6-phosphofructo-2-kinase-domain-containing protein [Jimgerdemannia flammicorona]|uniref:6-phosphofructo-2-kinase-domain-containing protein n=1 Tax=Jimgerdemannia flammicorona TaxID=994334 RepID=A0A433D0Y2_9FUNG|nr:6-phosphofructo-2-kinase-domain-containing protein [Jimgerdemannia flammicorona]
MIPNTSTLDPLLYPRTPTTSSPSLEDRRENEFQWWVYRLVARLTLPKKVSHLLKGASRRTLKPTTNRSSLSTSFPVCRYLTWLGITTKVFNVGNYRRKLHGANQPHTFFDPHNPAGAQSRREAASEALKDMLRWFDEEAGIVAIYDATNSTRERRSWLLEECGRADVQVLFIESVCQDENLILTNIKEVKLSSPDYANMDPDKAAEDFKARIEHYQEQYETITEGGLTYIKLINVGSQHGESTHNLEGKIGGDSYLSPRGEAYAKALPKLIKENLAGQNLTVWTSTLRRTIQTGQGLPYTKLQWKELDELDAGEKYPEDFANRDEDKFNYRYRGGEVGHDDELHGRNMVLPRRRSPSRTRYHGTGAPGEHPHYWPPGNSALYLRIFPEPVPRESAVYQYPAAHYHPADTKGSKFGFTSLCTPSLTVDIAAVNTHRPKPPKSSHLHLPTSTTLGASGEIIAPLPPIVPLSPQLLPRRADLSEKITLPSSSLSRPHRPGHVALAVKEDVPDPAGIPMTNLDLGPSIVDKGDAVVP